MTSLHRTHHIEDLLPALHNGTLAAGDRHRVIAHLRDCARCSAVSEEWAAIANASRALFRPGPAFFGTAMSSLTDNLPPQTGDTLMVASGSNLTAPIATPSRKRALGAPGAIPATLLVVILAVAIGVIGLRPPGNRTAPDRSIPAVALSAESTPVGSPSTEIACTTPAGDLSRLDLTGPTTTENIIMPPDLSTQEGSQDIVRISWRSVPTGPAADATTTEAVSSVVRQYIACANAGDAAAASALFTDDYWRRAQALDSPVNVENPRSFLAIGSEAKRSDIGQPEILGVYQLPDGRVLVNVRTMATNQKNFTAIVLINQAGTWRIDEGALAIKNAQLEVAVDDSGFSSTNLLVTAGKTELNLTNTGTRPHSIVCDELNLRIEVQPGETAYQTISYEEATLPFYSDMPGDEGVGFQGTITIDYSGDPTTPEASPETAQELPIGLGYINPGLMARLDVSSPAYYDPNAIALLANRDATIVITNVNPWNDGTFRIDALGIDVSIPVGESVTVPINAPPGIYVFYSSDPYSAINGMYGTLIVIDPDSRSRGYIGPEFEPTATPET
jgi:hypothetical protein